MIGLLQRALSDRDLGMGNIRTEVAEDALPTLARLAEGDARRAWVRWKLLCSRRPSAPVPLTADLIRESMQQKTIQYDPTGDEHYDVSSALIKSIRGSSDPDAALYWLARMLEAGEDIRFICRRLVILASEDIGNADPQALRSRWLPSKHVN